MKPFWLAFNYLFKPTVEPMNSDRIKRLQSRIGTEVDGFWGPKSIYACQAHLQRLIRDSPNKWPGTSQAELTTFYGKAGDESQLVFIDAPDCLKYEGQPVRRVRVNRKCAESLKRILFRLADTHPDILAEYAGVFNNRPMRGGSTPSLHARGAAIDLAPASNGNHDHWPSRADMPIEVMEAFAKEGWLPAGAFWGRDAMHFQATS
jgi:hypothetical protein